MFKRVLSMVLVLVTLVSVLPPRVEAEDVQPRVENSVTMEGTNSFGNLLANTMNESPEAQTEGEDNRVCDLVIEGTTATVEYTTTKNAKVVVAVYTEDGTKMLGSGTAEVTPEETAVVVEIQISPVPTYYSAGAYLLDAKTNDPLSPVFRTQLYTKAVQDIKNSTVEDYDPEKVLNLDGDNTTNFAVFGDRTILVREDSPVQITGGDGVYTVSNADERFLGMTAGDSFALMQEDGEVLIVKAAEVKVEGNTVTVWEDEDADLQDVFRAVKIEGASNADNVTYDDSTLDPELAIISEEEFLSEMDAVDTYAIIAEGAKDYHKDYKTGGKNFFATFEMNLSAGAKVYIDWGYQYISFDVTFSMTGKLTATASFSTVYSLGSFRVDLTGTGGCYIQITPKAYFNANCTLTYMLNWKASFGRQYDSSNGGWQDTSGPVQARSSVDFSGKIYVGIGTEIMIACLDEQVVNVAVDAEAGATISGAQHIDIASPEFASSFHQCKVCIDGDIVASLRIELSFTIFKIKKTIKTIKRDWKITDFYYCADQGEFDFSKCPHYLYAVVLKAVDRNDVPLPESQLDIVNEDGVQVEKAYQKDKAGRTVMAPIPLTNENGEMAIYLAAGEYAVTAMNSGLIESVDLKVKKEKNKKTIQLREMGENAVLFLSETNVEMSVDDEAKSVLAKFGDGSHGFNVTSACTWSSSDSKVVSVRNGEFEPVGNGTATVTATYTRKGKIYTAECNVVVKGETGIASGMCGDNLMWKISEDGTLRISGTGRMHDYGYWDDDIGDFTSAPWKKYNPRKLIMEEGITRIGKDSFWQCTELAGELRIPKSVTEIGWKAFGGCRGLTGELILPENLKTIGASAFVDCSGFTGKLTIPDNLEELSDGAFSGCNGFTGELIIPRGIKCIEERTFARCSGFTGDLIIPGNVKSIGDSAFSYCNGFTGDLVISEGVRDINIRAFSCCDGFKGNLVISDGVVNIGALAFEHCRGFSGKLILPDSVEKIGQQAFINCQGLSGVLRLPKGISQIEYKTFWNCTNLMGDIIIPEKVVSIGEGAFYNCTGFTGKLILPNGLTEIGKEAFYSCSSLTGELEVPYSVIKIGASAFEKCGSFSGDLAIPGNLDKIEPMVFKDCVSLTGELDIPKSVTSIGEGAFEKCSGLTGELIIPQYVTTIGERAFYGCSGLSGKLKISERVTRIGKNAFAGCAGFTGKLVLPTGINKLEEGVFAGCTGFTGELQIPRGVKCIEAFAFELCIGLDDSVNIAEGVEEIGYGAFHFCYAIKSVQIPSTMKKIGESAFYDLKALKDIWYNGTEENWLRIEIGRGNFERGTKHFVIDGVSESIVEDSDAFFVEENEELQSGTIKETILPTEEILPPDPTEETTPDPTEESIEETTEETTAYPEGTYVAPEGGDLVETPVLEEMSMHTGKETVKNGLRTVAFVGLEPGEEYVLIVSLRPGSVEPTDLQYIEQAAASAEGKVRFTYIPRTDVSAIPQLYGISAQREIKLDREYLTMPLDALSEPLTATVTPEEWADEVAWSSEDENILTVDSKGYVTPVAVGTGYAVATVRHGKYVLSARCRIDVTEQAPNEEVLSIDLTSPKVTTDLYSTDYTQIDILPRLPQNEVAAFAAAPEDNGAAITGAYLEDETARALFDLRVKDDRTLLVVPTQAAIEGAKGVKSSYSSKLAVSVNGVEYHTAEAVTIGVKKTLPKLKAGNLIFNPFYTGQSQALNITGGTVTKIEGTMPDWLELDGTKLTLKNAPKSGSASVNLLVYTEEWAVPVSVKVNVKLSYKAPAVKLSASSVSLSDSGSKGTTLKLSAGKKTLEELGVESIRLPEGFEETVLDLSTGEFNLVPTGAIPTGKQTVRVYFYDTDAVLDLPLTVGKKSPTLKLSKGSVNLNGDLGDSVTLKVTATPADLDLTKVVVTTPDEAVEVSPVNADGEFTVTVKAGTAPKANFPMTIQAPTGKAAKLTVKTLAAGQKVTMSLKAVGSIDLTYPEKGVDIQPVFKNYSGKLENIEYDLGDFLTLGEDDLLRWNGNIGLTTGTYPVTVTGNLPDGTVRSGTVKVKVIQTAVALKLGKTSLSLNKRLKESTQIAVTSGTKGYTLRTLGIRVTDSKNVPSDGLTASYADGLLTLAVNDRTAYGSTYKIQLWATSNKISTVTVKIPAEKASAVTMTAKAKGQIDVIRDASQVLVTPSYKNCLDGQPLGKQVKVTWAKDGKNYTQDVTGRFDLNWADSVLQVSRMPGETLELTGKYRLEILCEGMEKPAYVNLAVKSGTAKVTAAPVRLYTKDANHRAELTFMSSDRTLNAVARVELKDAKLKASYEVLDLGDGQFALRLRPGAKAKNGTVTVNLFFEGNNGKKPNATASVKVEIR